MSRLVAGFLEQLGGNEERFRRLLAEERRLRRQVRDFNAGDRSSRDEMHRRR